MFGRGKKRKRQYRIGGKPPSLRRGVACIKARALANKKELRIRICMKVENHTHRDVLD